MNNAYWQKWNKTYLEELEKNIMPFWMKHGFDRKHGGVYTCLNRDGSVIHPKRPWNQTLFVVNDGLRLQPRQEGPQVA